MEDIVGKKLVTKAGECNTSDALKPGQLVGIYFSAHWCPPCRAFTPVLAKVYNELNDSDPGLFEVVFMSSDKDDAAFNEYYGEMPWKAVPFSERGVKEAASQKYGIRGIPTLIIVKDGVIVTEDGRNVVAGSGASGIKGLK